MLILLAVSYTAFKYRQVATPQTSEIFFGCFKSYWDMEILRGKEGSDKNVSSRPEIQ